MIKFEEHDGMIFKMLEEPVPLTPDAEMPCLVRLIQDDSPMGRSNAFHLSPLLANNHPIIIDAVKDNSVSVVFNKMILYYANFEIIGYPVEEGSAEWALHQLMQGNVVRHLNGKPIHLDGDYMRCGNIAVSHIKDFLSKAATDGWRIYEPEQPKYKVGDWVEVECQNKLYHKQVLFVTENRVGFEFSGTTPSVCFDGTPSHIFKFIRKLSPSEVIVHIGCLSGTVRCCDNEFICPESTPDNPCHFVLQDQITGFWSIIYFKMLDAPTRELVKSLLEAQEEEK